MRKPGRWLTLYARVPALEYLRIPVQAGTQLVISRWNLLSSVGKAWNYRSYGLTDTIIVGILIGILTSSVTLLQNSILVRTKLPASLFQTLGISRLRTNGFTGLIRIQPELSAGTMRTTPVCDGSGYADETGKKITRTSH